MNLRFISTKVHGILDYLTAALAPTLPRVLGFSDRITRVHDIVGGTIATQAAVTNYELGLVKALPMKTHLTVDALTGLGLITCAAAVFTDDEPVERATMAGFGALSLLAAFCTKTQPSYNQSYEPRPLKWAEPATPTQEVTRPGVMSSPIGSVGENI